MFANTLAGGRDTLVYQNSDPTPASFTILNLLHWQPSRVSDHAASFA